MMKRLAFAGKKGILIDEDSTIRVTMGNNTSVILEEGPPATAGEFMVHFLVPNSTEELIIPLFNTMTIGQACVFPLLSSFPLHQKKKKKKRRQSLFDLLSSDKTKKKTIDE